MLENASFIDKIRMIRDTARAMIFTHKIPLNDIEIKDNIMQVNSYKFKLMENQKEEAEVLYHRFIEHDYGSNNIKGHYVIDIGAYIGDTAIYFVSRGAKKVFSYEPYTFLYEIAKENIKLNKMESRINLYNKGAGDPRYVLIPKDFKADVSSDIDKNFSKGNKIRILSLDAIMKDKPPGSNYILKVNCEGSEYPLILDANMEILRRFIEISIDCHKGTLNLEKKLIECGFKISKSYYGMSKEKYGAFMVANRIN